MAVAPKDQAAELRRLMASRPATLAPSPRVPRLARPIRARRAPLRTELGRPRAQIKPPPRLEQRTARVIAVASGKGGVGKTNIAANLAISLARRGRRVVLVDADLGTANADVLLNVQAPFDLSHVLNGRKSIDDIAVAVQPRLRLIAGASGLTAVADLSPFDRQRLIQQLACLETQADFILLDCGAGISQNVLAFTQSADELLVVTTPEPTALTDAYALVKVLSRAPRTPPTRLVVNQVATLQEGRLVAERIASVAARFLGLSVQPAAQILFDPHVGMAVRQRVPFVIRYPRSPASTCLAALADRVDLAADRTAAGPGFFARVLGFFY